MTRFQTVCEIEDVPPGQSRLCAINDTQVAVFNVGGEFFAMLDQCPHAGASLAQGYVEGDVVRCRIHHWGFCVRDGRYVDQNLPKFDAKTLPLRIEGNVVQVSLDG